MIPKRRDSRIAMHMLLQPARSIFRATLLLCGLYCASTGAQTTIATLPDNYKTIFENQDLLVMHVHYGAHEFVPMHDHSAYPNRVFEVLEQPATIQGVNEVGGVHNRGVPESGFMLDSRIL
jgi:hypothetical protein